MRRILITLLFSVLACTVDVDEAECEAACGVLDDCFDRRRLTVSTPDGPLSDELVGFDRCVDRCRNGGSAALRFCTDRDVVDAEGTVCRPAETDWTCADVRDCLQRAFDLEHETVWPIRVALAAAADVTVEGSTLTCGEGACGALDCAATPEEGKPPPPVELCDALGIESLWLGLEPRWAGELPTFTDPLPCLTAMQQITELSANASRVTVSVHARGTLPQGPVRGPDGADVSEYCWMLSRGSLDVAFIEDVVLPLRSAETIIAEAATAIPCVQLTE